MAVVTIQGQLGTMSKYIGNAAAGLLHAEYVDYEIVAQAAKRLGVDQKVVAERDERPSRKRDWLVRALQLYVERSGAVGDPLLGDLGMTPLMSRSITELTEVTETEAQAMRDRRFIEAFREAVQTVADAGDAVIMGRASNIILRDLPKAVHVYVVASLQTRIANRMKLDGSSRETAEQYIRETEERRKAFFKKFFKVDPDDVLNYDLVVNVDKLSVDAAARLIADSAREIAEAKAAAPSRWVRPGAEAFLRLEKEGKGMERTETPEELVLFLKGADIFHGLEESELALIVGLCEPVSFWPGDVLGMEGERGERLYVIRTGQVRFTTRADGETLKVRIAGSGESLPLAITLDPAVLITSAEAVSQVDALAIDKDKLLEVCDEHPAIGYRVYRSIAVVMLRRYWQTLQELSKAVGHGSALIPS